MKMNVYRMSSGLPVVGPTEREQQDAKVASKLISTLESRSDEFVGSGSRTVSDGSEVDYLTIPDPVQGDVLSDTAPNRSQAFDGINRYEFSVNSVLPKIYSREPEHEIFSEESRLGKTTILRDHKNGTIAVIEELREGVIPA
jgi:hypothetical protein